MSCVLLFLVFRDHAISAYTAAGLQVSVLGDAPLQGGVEAADADAALQACLSANEALIHRAVLKRPLSVLKYAMTLDGKIATGKLLGHAGGILGGVHKLLIITVGVPALVASWTSQRPKRHPARCIGRARLLKTLYMPCLEERKVVRVRAGPK